MTATTTVTLTFAGSTYARLTLPPDLTSWGERSGGGIRHYVQVPLNRAESVGRSLLRSAVHLTTARRREVLTQVEALLVTLARAVTESGGWHHTDGGVKACDAGAFADHYRDEGTAEGYEGTYAEDARLSDTGALDAIAGVLDGREWGGEGVAEVGRIVLATGRRLRSPEEVIDAPACPRCGTLLDEDGHCQDPGCPHCGKTPAMVGEGTSPTECGHCHEEVEADERGTLVDPTGGDVCGVASAELGENRPHVSNRATVPLAPTRLHLRCRSADDGGAALYEVRHGERTLLGLVWAGGVLQVIAYDEAGEATTVATEVEGWAPSEGRE